MTNLHDLDMEPWELLDSKLVGLSESSGTTVIKGGRVLDPNSHEIIDATLVIRGNKIDTVTSEPVDVSDDAQVIDATGATVLPGLIDCHIHFMGKTSTDPYAAYLNPSSNLKFVRAALELYQTLASGVTTVRALGHGPAEHAYALRRGVELGLIRGPRILTSGWALSQTRGHGDVPSLPYDWVEQDRLRAAFVDGELECRREVRRNFGEGADVIKVYTSDNSTGRPNFTGAELAAIVDEAHRRGRKVAAHAKTYEGVRNAVLAGIDTIEHGPSVVYPDVLEMMAERKTVLVPTLATVHLLAFEGERWGASPDTIARCQREYAGRLENVAAALEASVPVAMGSDTAARSGYGRLSTQEVALLTEAGMSPEEALVAATAGSAKAIGATSLGKLQVGHLADVVVCNGDLSKDISLLRDRNNIRYIFQTMDRWDLGTTERTEMG